MILGEAGGLNVDTVSKMIIPLPPVQNQKVIAEQMLRLSGGMELQEHYHKEMLKFNLFIDNL